MSPTCFSFFFNDTATTEIYTLSLHDALPISTLGRVDSATNQGQLATILNNSAEASSNMRSASQDFRDLDRKSTRLNSSHLVISYAVFCLKKKKNTTTN